MRRITIWVLAAVCCLYYSPRLAGEGLPKLEMFLHQVNTGGDVCLWQLHAVSSVWKGTAQPPGGNYVLTTEQAFTDPASVEITGDYSGSDKGYTTTSAGTYPLFGVAKYRLRIIQTAAEETTDYYVDYRDIRFWEKRYPQDHIFTFNAATHRLKWETTNYVWGSPDSIEEDETIAIWTMRLHSEPTEPIRPMNAAVTAYDAGEGVYVPRLSWTAYDQPFWTSYKIWRSINTLGGPPTTYNLIDSVGPTTGVYVDEGLAINGSWKVYYKLFASNIVAGKETVSIATQLECTAAGFYKGGAEAAQGLGNDPVRLSVYPNPFNASAELVATGGFSLGGEIMITDVIGRVVDMLSIPPQRETRPVRVRWTPQGLASGVYLIGLVVRDVSDQAQSGFRTQKVILAR